MNTGVDRCKSCGVVFKDLDSEIDKCAKKRIYCELCLAQKNPVSVTEQKIKRKYILLTAITALAVFAILIAVNWGKSENNNLFEYIVSFGLGYIIVWGGTALVFLPFLRMMKKPHKTLINREKEEYIEDLEKKKESRKTAQDK